MTSKFKTALYGAALLVGMGISAIDGDSAQAAPLRIIGQAAPARLVTFDVLLPLRNMSKLEALLKAQQDTNSAQYHKWLTPAQFGERFGPDAATKQRVAEFLRSKGFTVRMQTRSMRVTGTANAVARNFGVQLMLAESTPGTTHVIAQQNLTMPAELASAGARVLSFAPHVAHAFSHASGKSIDNRNGDTGAYWFDDLKQAYQYPSAADTVVVNGNTLPLNGKGATIAALMSSDVLDTDISAMFDHEKWSTFSGSNDPVLAGRVYINGGAAFGNGASLEASLDVQQELTGAPGANVVLYDIPDLSDGSVMAGYVDIDENNSVDVVSSSFGECELFYFPRYNGGQDFRGVLQAEHELFMQGNSQGITFLASSGDSAGEECLTPSYLEGGPTAHFIPGVSTPADDPNVTSVGGTNLVTTADGSLNSAYVEENAWDDPEVPYDPYGVGVNASGGEWGAGGGYSALWSAPDYQSMVTTGSSMRALPDIGMQVGGCPGGIAKLHHHECDGGDNPVNGNGNTQRSAVAVAYGVGVGGGFYGVIGTSVSSPEFAGVVAHLVEQKGRQGNLNPYLYKLAAKQAAGGRTVFHTAIPGYNGVQNTDVSSTYSLSTGVGTPIVTGVIGQPNAVQAGLPQTTSNP